MTSNINDESRALLAAIVDHSDDAIISMDLNARITSWNHAAESIFGYTAAEAIGQPIMMLLPPDRAAEEPEFLRRVIRGERIRHYETRRRAKSGAYLDISLTISPIINSEGQVIGASKIARDISRERQARERLRQSEEWFRVTLSSIGDAVIATDGAGIVTFMNPVAESLTGWTQPEAVGKPLESIFRIVNERTRLPVENPVAKVIRDGGVAGLANHTILIAKNGAEIPIGDSGAPISGSAPEIVGAVLVFRDVTENRRAEFNALRLASIVQNSDDAIIGKDLRGIITTWNEGAQRIFGYTAEEIVGKSIFTLIPPDLHFQETEILARLQRGERIVHFETTRLAKGDRPLTVSLTISPVKDAEGRVIGASKIARDITEQKAIRDALHGAKLELEAHAKTLESMVEDRTHLLRKAVEELEAFSYSLSHDMRAPLRAIQSFLEIVVNDWGEKIGGDGLKLLKRAIATAERMDKLILDLLNFTRISRSPLTLEIVDAASVVKAIIDDRPDFHLPKARIEVAPDIPPVTGNTASLVQALGNLLDNAVKFVAPGVVPKVRVWGEKQGDDVRIFVKDNGIGIDPEAQSRLFKVFQRVNTGSYQGSGIGLALVRKAVERMGGEAGVESEPGKGSCFWIQLRGAAE